MSNIKVCSLYLYRLCSLKTGLGAILEVSSNNSLAEFGVDRSVQRYPTSNGISDVISK